MMKQFDFQVMILLHSKIQKKPFPPFPMTLNIYLMLETGEGQPSSAISYILHQFLTMAHPSSDVHMQSFFNARESVSLNS